MRRRRPPTFMPGMPSCQPLMRPDSGNWIDWPRFQVGVELLAGLEVDAEVVHVDRRAGLGDLAGALLEIDDHEAR